MPITRRYSCPDCFASFPWLHERSDQSDVPDFCPKCGSNVSGVEPELSAPHIARSIGRVADNVYRAVEQSSEARAEMAAEMLPGESAADLVRAMKVTDIRDDARPGETSARPVDNEVSRSMAAPGTSWGLQDSSAGMQWAAGTQAGPGAGRHGANMTTVLRDSHAANVQQAVSRHTTHRG